MSVVKHLSLVPILSSQLRALVAIVSLSLSGAAPEPSLTQFSTPCPSRRPRLLICDEATSALDTATERGIQASLRALAAGRTAVFVAHRLSTVQGCDRIYVLADGRVAEQGTHAQLMAGGPIGGVGWRVCAPSYDSCQSVHPFNLRLCSSSTAFAPMLSWAPSC